MLIQASNIPVALDALLPQNEGLLVREVANALHIKASQVKNVCVTRKAVDARKKSNVHFVLSAPVTIDGLEDIGKLRPQKGVQVQLHFPNRGVQFPSLDEVTNEPGYLRPIVVGAGPAGLFCALALAYAGARPLLIERGKPVEERMRSYIEQIKNPYMFKVGGTIVRVSYANTQTTINDNFVTLLSGI